MEARFRAHARDRTGGSTIPTVPDALAKEFAADVRTEGQELHRTGLVQQFEVAGSTVTARTGKRRKFRVFLIPRPGGLGLQCRCPAFTSMGSRCEHMWAVLLAAVERGLLEHLLRAPADAAAPPPAPEPPPPDLPLRDVRGVPRPCAEARSQWIKSEGHSGLVVRAAFEYDGVRIPELPRGETTVSRADLARVHRDLAAEDRLLSQLEELKVGLYDVGSNERLRTIPRTRFPSVVSALLKLGWTVEAEGKLYRKASHVSTSVATGVDWFDLSGNVDFDGVVMPLPAVLRWLRRNRELVPLGDGTFGVLPEVWLERLKLLGELSRPGTQALRFERCQQGLLSGLLAGLPDSTVDAGFEQAREALRSFDRIRPAEDTPGFSGELRDYQKEGLGWLRFLGTLGLGGCLADDMGLGKTVQVLALLAGIHARADRPAGASSASSSASSAGSSAGNAASLRLPPAPSLVVVPRSLVDNWVEEAARFAPDLRVVVHHGPGRTRETAALARADVVVTTYGTLRRDIHWLKDLPFACALLDEAQAIKNPATDAAKAVRLLTCRRRLALTGTPVENHLGELLSLMDFLNPGLFGRSSLLARAARRGIPLDEELLAALRTAIRPFLLRRTKLAVERQLPARTEQTLHCHLEPQQRALYDQLREHYRSTLLGAPDPAGEPRQIQVLEALLRLRQVACHPGLVEPGLRSAASAKLEALVPALLELAAEGHKALVFSQFTSLLALVRERLDREGLPYEYLDGSVRDRASRVKRFQEDPGVPAFLISLRAGGLGLNLTAAEYVYILDPWWNPAVEAQAVDRAHRIGQTRAVVAYRLVAKDTVEDRILELQESKRQLADAILSEDSGPLASLTREDLERLLA